MKYLCYYLFGVLFLLTCAAANAQSVITGTVLDGETKETMPGVSVLIKGTHTGDYTSPDGKFTVKAHSLPVTLVFSFIGFETLELQVNSADQNISVELRSRDTDGGARRVRDGVQEAVARSLVQA